MLSCCCLFVWRFVWRWLDFFPFLFYEISNILVWATVSDVSVINLFFTAEKLIRFGQFVRRRAPAIGEVGTHELEKNLCWLHLIQSQQGTGIIPTAANELKNNLGNFWYFQWVLVPSFSYDMSADYTGMFNSWLGNKLFRLSASYKITSTAALWKLPTT